MIDWALANKAYKDSLDAIANGTWRPPGPRKGTDMSEDRIVKLEADVAFLKRKMANTRKRTEILKVRLDRHREEEHDEIESNITNLQSDVAMLSNTINGVYKELKQLQDDFNMLNDVVGQVGVELREYKAQIAAKIESIIAGLKS